MVRKMVQNIPKMKKKILYVWEGSDTITITRGTPAIGERYKHLEVKHKGIFGRNVPCFNIRDTFFGETKDLCVNDRILPTWKVVRIKMDYLTKEPFIPDLNPALMSRIRSLENEVETWKKMYHDSRDRGFDSEQHDRFIQRVKKEFKFVGDAKNQLFSPTDYFGGSRWGIGGGLGGGGTPPQE
jgi:hypothetical protein